MKHRIKCEFRCGEDAEFSGTVRNPHTFMDDKVFVCRDHVKKCHAHSTHYLIGDQRFWIDGKMEGGAA